jgi:hypothetical protein
LAVFLAACGVAQQEDAAGVEQQEEPAFFFEKRQWPLEQLLSRRLVETRAKVRSNFMWIWCGCPEASKGRMTRAQLSEENLNVLFQAISRIKVKSVSCWVLSVGMKKPGRVASGLRG